MSKDPEYLKKCKIISRERKGRYSRLGQQEAKIAPLEPQEADRPRKIYLNSFNEYSEEYLVCGTHVTTMSHWLSVLGFVATFVACVFWATVVETSGIELCIRASNFNLLVYLFAMIVSGVVHYKVFNGIHNSIPKKLLWPLVVYSITTYIEIGVLIFLWVQFIFFDVFEKEGVIGMLVITMVVFLLIAGKMCFGNVFHKTHVFLINKDNHQKAVRMAEEAEATHGMEIVYVGRLDSIPLEAADVINEDTAYVTYRTARGGILF